MDMTHDEIVRALMSLRVAVIEIQDYLDNMPTYTAEGETA